VLADFFDRHELRRAFLDLVDGSVGAAQSNRPLTGPVALERLIVVTGNLADLLEPSCSTAATQIIKLSKMFRGTFRSCFSASFVISTTEIISLKSTPDRCISQGDAASAEARKVKALRVSSGGHNV